MKPLPFENADFAGMARNINDPGKPAPLPANRSNLAHDVLDIAKTGIETYGQIKKGQIDAKRQSEINTINAMTSAAKIAGLGLQIQPGMYNLPQKQIDEFNRAAEVQRAKDKTKDTQTKVDDWVTEDLTDPAMPKYFLNRATADKQGNMKTSQLTIDKPAYEQMKRKQDAGPKPDKLGTAEARLIQMAGWDADGVDKYGNPAFKRFPEAVARKRLKALRASYYSQHNMPAVNQIDAELSMYNEPAIGDGATDLTPAQISAGWKRINDNEIQDKNGRIVIKPLIK